MITTLNMPVSATILILAFLLSPASGADTGAEPDETAEPRRLERIKVTARRSEERARDIPFGLSVIDGETLKTRRLMTVEDVLRSVPGVDVNSWGGANDANVRIRGVGSLNQMSMDDSSVVLNIDGISMSARHASLATFDIERVEILKGPQGTLFGRNSEAGAINITTRRPTPYFDAGFRAEIGQEGQHLQEAVISGPLSEHLSGRFAIRNSGSDNWVKNARTGDPISKPHELGFRGSLLWNPDGGTSALLVLERQEAEHKAGMELLRPYPDSPSLDFAPDVFDENEKMLDRYSFEVNHELNNSRLTSVTAYTNADFLAIKGYDRAITRALYGSPFEYRLMDESEERVMSQDLRWASLPRAPIFWVAGLNLSHSDRTFDSVDFTTSNIQERTFKNDSSAIYGEVTYPLTNALKLTVGLRHTWDRQRYNGNYTAAGTSAGDRHKLNDNYSTGRIALSYAIAPGTNLYGIISRGYKSGGFNDYATQAADSAPYKAATSHSAELGLKTESEDRHFIFNGALFISEVRNDHLLGYNFQTLAVSAINGDTRSKGVEFDGIYHFGNGFSISGSVSYIDAQITSNAHGVSGGDVSAGNQVPDVPRWSGNLGMAYRRPLPKRMGLSSPALNARINHRMVGRRPADPQNHFDLKRYVKLDFHVGIESGNSEIYAWVDNLTNADYELHAFYLTPTVSTGTPARGHTVGIGFRYML